jgi:hypothetical protein
MILTYRKGNQKWMEQHNKSFSFGEMLKSGNFYEKAYLKIFI